MTRYFAATSTIAMTCFLAVACSSGGNSGGQGGDGAGAGGTPGAAGIPGTAGAAGAAVAGHGGSAGPGGAGAGGAAVAGSPGTGGAAAGAGGSAPGGSGVAGAAVAGSGGSARGGSNGVAGGPGGSGAGGSGVAGSGVAGGAGSPAGGAGGSAPTPVTPTKSGNSYRFTFGDVVFEIDQMVGGRVGKLAIGGSDLIMTSATDATTWGSVFWTSPRADWTSTTNDWPPPTAIDNAAYTGDISGTHVVVSGPTDSYLGVSMKKDYAVDSSGWITINYTINATKAIKAAPWEVSRVPRGGIVFFPYGSSLTKGPFTVTQTSGIAWIDDGPKTVTSPDGAKCYADGKGWEAYVVGGNLFLKKFTDQPATAQPTGEGEIDVYPGNGFMEFEVQGPYTQIAANGTLPWSTQWKVVKVPSSVTIGVSSTTLVDFAKQQLGL